VESQNSGNFLFGNLGKQEILMIVWRGMFNLQENFETLFGRELKKKCTISWEFSHRNFSLICHIFIFVAKYILQLIPQNVDRISFWALPNIAMVLYL